MKELFRNYKLNKFNSFRLQLSIISPFLMSCIKVIFIFLCHFLALYLGHTKIRLSNDILNFQEFTILIPNISPTTNQNPEYYFSLFSMTIIIYLYLNWIPLFSKIFHINTRSKKDVPQQQSSLENIFLKPKFEKLTISFKKIFQLLIIYSFYIAFFFYFLQSIFPLQQDFLQNWSNRYNHGIVKLNIFSKTHLIFAGLFFLFSNFHCTCLSFFIILESLSDYCTFLNYFTLPCLTIISKKSKLLKCIIVAFLWCATIAHLSYFILSPNRSLSSEQIIFRINIIGFFQRMIVFSLLAFISTYTIDLNTILKYIKN